MCFVLFSEANLICHEILRPDEVDDVVVVNIKRKYKMYN